VYPKDDSDIKKLKKLDKERFGNIGFDSRYGYVSFEICLDMVKLLAKGYSPATISNMFNLSTSETLTILVSFNKFIDTNTDTNDLKFLGGLEYAEIQKLKDKPNLNEEDLTDILIDIYLLSKENLDNKKTYKKKGKHDKQDN
jgi:hypothetical protein